MTGDDGATSYSTVTSDIPPLPDVVYLRTVDIREQLGGYMHHPNGISYSERKHYHILIMRYIQ